MLKGMRLNRGSATVGTTSGVLIPINPNRWGVIISSPQSSRITLDFGGPAVLDAGVTLYPSNLPLILGYEHIGEAIMTDVFAIGVAGTQTIGWMEVFWP
jgi:hypothetical protein